MDVDRLFVTTICIVSSCFSTEQGTADLGTIARKDRSRSDIEQ